MKTKRSPRQRYFSFLIKVILIFTLAFGPFMTQPASAQKSADGGTIWYVSTIGDDANSCATTDAPCLTINGAIAKAIDGDTIQVAIGTYVAASGTQVVLINKSATLSGGWDENFTTQSGRSTIDGQDKRRGIFVYSPTTVVVDHFIIQNGYNDSEAGGIYNSLGDLTLNNSVVKNNRGDWYGGGITNDNNLTINYTTISGNTTGKPGGGGGDYGGAGIRNNNGTVVLNSSTVSNNQIIGGYSGSGIFTKGALILNNSTVSGNTGGSGEGIRVDTGTLILNNSTISDNEAFGFYNTGGDVSLQNSIVAGNRSNNSDCFNHTDFGGKVKSQGYNLIGNTSGCTIRAKSGDKFGNSLEPINPQLAPLGNNGGLTYTHALHKYSPALNAGNPAIPGSDEFTCITADQRGTIRPKGLACDIGAFEGYVLYPDTLLPAGTISDKTPSYEWSKIPNATKYQYELWKGTTHIYTKNVPASVCNSSFCLNTPSNVLKLGSYKWRIRAMIDGAWTNYSPYKPFVIFRPKPGFWSWSDDSPRFYVLNPRPVVADFSILIRHPICGIRRITHIDDATINGRNFSLPGSFSVSGTFSNATQVSGTLALYNYYIPGCGYGSGGPYPWTAVWKSNAQPDMLLNNGEPLELTASPEFSTPFEILTVDPEK